jgi:hypothetical protein
MEGAYGHPVASANQLVYGGLLAVSADAGSRYRRRRGGSPSPLRRARKVQRRDKKRPHDTPMSLAPFSSPRAAPEPLTFREARDRLLELSGDDHRSRAVRSPSRQ